MNIEKIEIIELSKNLQEFNKMNKEIKEKYEIEYDEETDIIWVHSTGAVNCCIEINYVLSIYENEYYLSIRTLHLIINLWKEINNIQIYSRGRT